MSRGMCLRPGSIWITAGCVLRFWRLISAKCCGFAGGGFLRRSPPHKQNLKSFNAEDTEKSLEKSREEKSGKKKIFILQAFKFEDEFSVLSMVFSVFSVLKLF